MTPEVRRRYERNLREQQRSHRISNQIKDLRNVLSESKVPFKPNKFSILMSVAQYIKQLQNRSTMLDGEMKKLLNTIRKSSELVNSGLTQPNLQHHNQNNDLNRQNTNHDMNSRLFHNNMNHQNNNTGGGGDGGIHTNSDETIIGNDAETLFVKGLDFHAIFEQASIALGIASLDGRILRCNSKFESVSGFSKEQLENQNVFHLLEQTEIEDAYKALGKFLKSTDTNTEADADAGTSTDTGTSTSTDTDTDMDTTKEEQKPQQLLQEIGGASNMDKFEGEEQGQSSSLPGYWSGRLQQPNLQMDITLSRTADGSPKFLNCALSLINRQQVLTMVEGES